MQQISKFCVVNNEINYAWTSCFGLTAIIRLEIWGSHIGEDVDRGHLVCDAMWSCRQPGRPQLTTHLFYNMLIKTGSWFCVNASLRKYCKRWFMVLGTYWKRNSNMTKCKILTVIKFKLKHTIVESNCNIRNYARAGRLIVLNYF